MSDEILSQKEIDQLLSSLKMGELMENIHEQKERRKKVEVYDFKRALRFSKDQIRSLTRIYENYARHLTTVFSAYLRTYVQITVASADQILYEEYIRSISNMTFLSVLDLQTLKGKMVLEIHPSITYAIIDRILGGKGSSISRNAPLTDIEKTLMGKLLERTLGPLKDAWAGIAPIDPKLAEFEENPQFLQVVTPNETVVVISMNAMVGETNGMINVCIPHVVLEPVIPKLSVQHWMGLGSKERQPEAIESLERNLKETNVDITAELGSTDLSIVDFLSLNEGDVFPLEKRIDEPLVIKVGGVPKFLGQPGKKNNKLAVQILSMLAEGDENDE